MPAHNATPTTISSDQTLVADSDKRSASANFPYYSVGDIVLYDSPDYAHNGDIRKWRTYLISRNDLTTPDEEWLYQLIEIGGIARLFAPEKHLHQVQHSVSSRVRFPKALNIRPSAVTGVFNSSSIPYEKPCWVIAGLRLEKTRRQARVVYDVQNVKVNELYGVVRDVMEASLEPLQY